MEGVIDISECSSQYIRNNLNRLLRVLPSPMGVNTNKSRVDKVQWYVEPESSQSSPFSIQCVRVFVT
jgi:hypothetical protein